MDKKQLEELKKLPFEKALEQLESVVSKMENGQLPLDEMMKAYEEGQALSSVCGEKLKSIEKKVEILRKKANGKEEWVDFDSGAGASGAASIEEEDEETEEAEERSEDLPF